MNIHWRTLLAWAAGISGLTSCDNLPFIGACMYGTPSADYNVTLTVTDEDGNPVKGIEASGNGRPEKPLTDQSGVVKMNLEGIIYPHIVLTDIDGEDNGGEFEELQVSEQDLTVKQIKKGDGNWYQGAFEATGTVKMKKASEAI